MKILVVDDDEFSGDMIAAVLTDNGYETVSVDSGVAALDAVAGDPCVAAVVSDMNMPGVSGLDLFSALREKGCELPFILLSGSDPDTLRRREPRLDYCIAKDGDLEVSLPQTLARALTARARP